MARLVVFALAAVLAVPALFSGCIDEIQSFEKVYDPCRPLVLVASGEFTADEWESVEDGVAMWQQVARVEATTDDSLPLEEARRIEVRMVDSNFYLGAFDDVEGVIKLARRVDIQHARAVVLAHELGHAYNLFHVKKKQRPSVMNRGNWKTEPTDGDAEELAHKWGDCVRW